MIDPKIQADLRAKFNPDGSDLRKMQLRMLEMLKYIDKICRENNIKYWLSSGTCLGAVRHGGFIPWDDDCDIEMFRPDFIKLRKAILGNPKSPYIWQDHSTDSAYLAPYAKLRDPASTLNERTYNDRYYTFHGIYIDIFILEPSNFRILRRVGNTFQYRCLFYLNLIRNKFLRENLIRLNWCIIHGIIFPLLNLPDRLSRNKEIFRHTIGSIFLKPRVKSSIGETKRVAFEGEKFPVPEDAEKYLSTIYGEFNTLPDINQLNPHISEIEIK